MSWVSFARASADGGVESLRIERVAEGEEVLVALGGKRMPRKVRDRTFGSAEAVEAWLRREIKRLRRERFVELPPPPLVKNRRWFARTDATGVAATSFTWTARAVEEASSGRRWDTAQPSLPIEPATEGYQEISSNLDAMMEVNARVACEVARASGQELDWSVDSLTLLEALAGRLHDDLRAGSDVTEGQRAAMSLALGAYLGEVVVRACAGRWRTHPLEINVLAVALSDGRYLDPVGRARRRLEEGSEHDLVSFAAFAETRLDQ